MMSSAALIYGAMKNKRLFLLPWLVGKTIANVVHGIFLLIVTLALFAVPHVDGGFIALYIASLLYFGLYLMENTVDQTLIFHFSFQHSIYISGSASIHCSAKFAKMSLKVIMYRCYKRMRICHTLNSFEFLNFIEYIFDKYMPIDVSINYLKLKCLQFIITTFL